MLLRKKTGGTPWIHLFAAGKRFTHLRGKLDEVKATRGKRVIITAFIDDANQAMGRGVSIWYDAIKLADLQRCWIALIF